MAQDNLHIGLWIAGGSLLVCGLALYFTLLYWRDHGGADYMPLAIVLLLLAVSVIATVRAVVKNVGDASRAKSLHAQIVTIKEDHALEMSAFADRFKSQISALQTELQRAKDERMSLPSGRTEPLDSIFSQLQIDAVSLSAKLLRFIDAQGLPPQPKYTREQLDRMPMAEGERLIRAEDRDYIFACEYYYGGAAGGGAPFTSDHYLALMLARITLLDPWFDKVRAAYELEFAAEVSKFYNRFSVEGLRDERLKIQIEGKMVRENIRSIASVLWDLAYRVRDKEVVIEKSGL